MAKKSYYPKGRTLHLIDAENMMGGPKHEMALLSRTLSCYRAVARFADSDHGVIGVNPRLHLMAKLCWPSVKVESLPGPDGADIVLIQHVANHEWQADRYDRLVIGSGDGIFVDVVRVYRRLGMEVEVVARRSSLSHALAVAATRVRYFPEVDLPVAA